MSDSVSANTPSDQARRWLAALDAAGWHGRVPALVTTTATADALAALHAAQRA